jgi:hypothetical protein
MVSETSPWAELLSVAEIHWLVGAAGVNLEHTRTWVHTSEGRGDKGEGTLPQGYRA